MKWDSKEDDVDAMADDFARRAKLGADDTSTIIHKSLIETLSIAAKSSEKTLKELLTDTAPYIGVAQQFEQFLDVAMVKAFEKFKAAKGKESIDVEQVEAMKTLVIARILKRIVENGGEFGKM